MFGSVKLDCTEMDGTGESGRKEELRYKERRGYL